MTNAALDSGIREQQRTLHRRLADGMPRAGWKICINDRRMQRRLGIDASFVGFLDGSRALQSGGEWVPDAGAVLGVEPEIALRFASRVTAGDDGDAICRAIAGAAPAIEVVDWRDAKFDLASLAASSSFHAGFVVGELRPLAAVPAIAAGCPLFVRAGEVLGAADPDLVPADLAALVATVAGFLARYDQRIESGDWLLCGACTSPARVESGDAVEADFHSLGRVSLRFGG